MSDEADNRRGNASGGWPMVRHWYQTPRRPPWWTGCLVEVLFYAAVAIVLTAAFQCSGCKF